MSIKKLFDSTDNSNNYLSDTTNKEAFQEVESERNVKAVSEKQETYIPQVDYTDPANFARYGSAYLYYKSAMERVADFYPYDGSDAETNEFYNESLDIDKYVFDNLYPKSTGYVILSADGWGNRGSTAAGKNVLAASGGYGVSTTTEYITVYGGPNTVTAATTAKLFQNPNSSNRSFANVYDTDIYTNNSLISNYGSGSRESNLKSDFDNGVTVEFWYKSGSDATVTDTQRQVVFDMWNNELSSSADFGRITIALDLRNASTRAQPWIVTAQSGNDNGVAAPNTKATGIFQQSIGAGSSSLGEWRHYAFSFYNSGSNFISKLHINGQLDDTNVVTANLNELNSKNMMGRIAGLLTAPSGTLSEASASHDGPSELAGGGKLDGSLDEFRFWKIRRSSHEIAKHYFTQVGAGTNTDISNTTLGLYYKFNEGITGTSTTDNVVLDYSGRISNGTWTGYGSNSRNTGSAIISASAATVEYEDPIIRTDHPDVVTVKTNLLSSGSFHDSNNNTSILSMLPAWVVEEQENNDAGADINNLKIMSHIIGVYFDKLYLLISSVARFRNQTYTSSSYVPLPFAQHMPQSLGLYTPETFIDSDVLERFMNRDQTTLFEGDLTETKNLIYLNLYNNLAHIFKAKGTEKAIRNVFRCFNIDERLIKLNAYSNRRTYELKNNLTQILVNKTALNFNHKNNLSGTVYQARPYATTYDLTKNDWFGGAHMYAASSSLKGWWRMDKDRSAADNILDEALAVSNVDGDDWSTLSRLSFSESNYPSIYVQTASCGFDGADMGVNIGTAAVWNDIIGDGGTSKMSFSMWVYKVGDGGGSLGRLFEFGRGNEAAADGIVRAWTTATELIWFNTLWDDTWKDFYTSAAAISLNTWAHVVITYDATAGANVPKIYVNGVEQTVTAQDSAGSDWNAIKVTDACIGNYKGGSYGFNGQLSDVAVWNDILSATEVKAIYNASKEGVTAVSDGETRGYISGSNVSSSLNTYEDRYGFTVEAGVLFPSFEKRIDTFDRSFTTSSLFGMATVPASSSLSGARLGIDTTTVTGSDNYANFQAFAVRDTEYSKNAYFMLTSSGDPLAGQYTPLTSSIFYDVYDNTEWNFSVRIKPSNYPLTEIVTGSTTYTYDVIFKGINTVMGDVQNTFSTSASITQTAGQKILRSNKRLYAGAQKTNITGALLYKSDVLLNDVKYWAKYLEDSDLEQHAFDVNNRGVSGSNRHLSPWGDKNHAHNQGLDILNWNTLALNWNFDNVTGSNANGALNEVTDISSGSAVLRNNYGWLGNLAGYQLAGSGSGFGTSSSDVVNSQAISAYKFTDPEIVVSSDMVQILSDDDKVFGNVQTVPDYRFVLEKSIYGIISEEMLQFFAGVVDFNNIIGEPVNRYRDRYKALEKLRNIFFRRVTEVKHVEKYIEYFKWFDSSIAEIIGQLLPASADYSGDIYNVIESHVLERNKYQTKFPTMEFKSDDPYGLLTGWSEASWAAVQDSSPPPASPRKTNEKPRFWLQRADRSSAELTSGDATVDTQRNTIRDTIWSAPTLTQSAPVVSDAGGTNYTGSWMSDRQFAKTYNLELQNPFGRKNKAILLRGGTNFEHKKDIHFVYNALYPAGPVNTDDGNFIPKNILISFRDDMELLEETSQWEVSNKYKDHIKRHMKVQHGRDWEDGLGYSNFKSSFAFPFNVISSSVVSGYNMQVVQKVTAAVEITNLHHDVYGPDMEKPMQGTFTEFAVGGHQSRHVALNKSSSTKTLFTSGLDNYLTRPEAWKIVLGVCDTGHGPGNTTTGAIGMVGADYPWPEANAVGATPYPMTASQKAVYYRDELAKRPVNIRNIQSTTSSVLGNYSKNYEVVYTVGAYTNPRRFIDKQPALPTPVVNHITTVKSSSTNIINNFINLHRGEDGHFDFDLTYAPTQFTGSGNKTVIVNRFAVHGGPEVMSRGFQDLRGSEFSPYNCISYRNLTVIKPSQGPSGTISEATGSGIPGIRVYDIHGKDYGLRAHLARHSAKFGRDSFWVTSNWGASTDESASFHKIPRNTTKDIRLSADTPTTASVYDNFFVQHQIPRKDKNYAWFTASLNISSSTNDMRYYQLAPTFGTLEGYYSTSAGIESYFDFITGSSYTASAHPSFVQSTNRLNLFIRDPVDDSTNIIGYATTANVANYINTPLVVDTMGVAIAANNLDTHYFNLLMAKRGNLYGWSWKKAGFRQSDNPILYKEKLNNQISVLTGSSDSIAKYRLTPLSTKGRPTLINFSISTTKDVTIKATHNNSHIFFDETAFNNFVFSSDQLNSQTSFDKLTSAVAQTGYRVNWVVYSEALYPSLYNEYYSSSIQRAGYDNEYWRDNSANRVTLGATFNNSFGVNNYNISQSAWLLDPQDDFLTRTVAAGPSAVNPATDTAVTVGAILSSTDLRLSGSSGELQNNYFFSNPYYGTGSGVAAAMRMHDRSMIRGLSPAALYSRKHMLPNPKSVVAKMGVAVAETGSLSYFSDGFKIASMVDIYCGEALWEAGSQAGLVVKNGSTVTYQSYPSKPWFNEYSDYSYELKLIAKDFSVLPEFRISEHIDDYEKYGLFNKGKTDTFKIPGTSLDSSNSGFYKDYSNSDFMSNFLNIKNSTSLNAKEIKLVCSAAIRFNPYKGFYPAQRTLDLVSQFSSSHVDGLYATGSEVFISGAGGIAETAPDGRTAPSGQQLINRLGGALRPLVQPLFAPGILYNSIKSGLAVDYPVVVDETKLGKFYYSSSVTYNGTAYALNTSTGTLRSASAEAVGSGSNWALGVRTYATSSDQTDSGWNGTGSYFDVRIPFEAIINPENHINGVMLPDMEAHPSASVNATASWGGTPADTLYSKMASNFFGEVGSFFLKDGTYTKLESGVVTNDLRFESGSVYGARLKIRRSALGARTYQYESSSWGNNQGYGKFGALLYTASNYVSSSEYPIPQDPRQNPGYKETFTMYSRPTSFGPDCAGRPTGSYATSSYVINRAPADCFNGFNWAYTPPYYYGEAWVDFVFWPDHTKSYDLEQILAETQVIYRRVDSGHEYADASGEGTETALLANFSNTSSFYESGQHFRSIYGGKAVNDNAMQLSASINLFGVDTILEQEKDKFGNLIKTTNKISGKRWIIQPKFETPMLNFNDVGIHGIKASNNNLTVPDNFGAAATPRGMWHQFGVIPEKSTLGVFMEIGDIPKNWLKYHYDVLENNSFYNNNGSILGSTVNKKMKSLSDLVGFEKTNSSVRLGELANTKTIKEAVVAIPYIIESVSLADNTTLSSEYRSTRKKFIELPEERYAAALEDAAGSLSGDSLDAAGKSIRKLLQKMDKYILPPQFDFKNNDSVDPIVMYMFEFEYKLDKDDLSYIWQNIAPRDYRKMEIQVESVAHELINTELLDEDILMNNENLRWMVFKVKQKGQTEYNDQIVTQAGSSNSSIFNMKEGSLNRTSESDDYNLAFNWPYDYLSFVEMVKFEAEVLYASGSNGG